MSDERERFEKAAGPYRREFWHPWACWQAAILAERERCAKIAQKRANVLFELESIGPLMIALKTAADELKRVADAIRRGEEV